MGETLNPVHRLFENAPIEASHNRLPEKMISADSHVTEPPHTYTKYIDPKFRDRAPRITPRVFLRRVSSSPRARLRVRAPSQRPVRCASSRCALTRAHRQHDGQAVARRAGEVCVGCAQ